MVLKKKKELQTSVNPSQSEEIERKSKCFCSDESYIYGRDLSLGKSVPDLATMDQIIH